MGPRQFMPITKFSIIEPTDTTATVFVSVNTARSLNINLLSAGKATTNAVSFWVSSTAYSLHIATASGPNLIYFGEQGLRLAASAPLGYKLNATATVCLGVVGYES